MPLTGKYEPKVHRDNPLFDEQQMDLLKLQEKIFEAVFGPRRDPTIPFNVQESRNPPGVNPRFNPYFLKIRARGYPEDPRIYFHVEVPKEWKKNYYSDPELPFKDLEYGDTGEYGIKKKYRNFVVRASFEQGMDIQEENAISALGKVACPKNRHGERLGTERFVPGLRMAHRIETENGRSRTVYVSVLAVKPRVVPLSDVVEQIARYPSLVEDLVYQMYELRLRLSYFRLQRGRYFEKPHSPPPDQPWVGLPFDLPNRLGLSHQALPSGDLSRCSVRLPPGGIPKKTAGDYHSMKRLIHILAEVAPSSLNRNVTIEDNCAFRIFMGNNFPATEFTQSDILRLSMTFALTYDFHNFGQILVRPGKRIDPITQKPFWDIKHLHDWDSARFEPIGLDNVRWDTQFPIHLPGYAAFYTSFRQVSSIPNPKEEDCPRLRDASLRYAQTMYDLWTKSYKGMYEDEDKARREWLKKMRSAGWSYKGVEKGWEKGWKKTVGGSLRRAFR